MDWPGVEVDVGEFFYGAAQGLLPARVHAGEFGVVVLKAPVAVEVQLVVLVEQDFQGRANGHVGAHRGI